MLSETLVLKLVIYGQGYDGAGNMAGKKSGVSSRILKLNDKA